MGSFLLKHKLQRQPGEKSVYSNLGVGLLGHTLQLKSGYDYESLLEDKITGPLEMANTKITLDDDDLKRLAIGHDSDGQPVSNWDLPTFAGAGAIRSTTGDMLKFLASQLGLKKSKLDPAIAKTHEVHFKIPENEPFDMGLGWLLQRNDGIIWHNGGTGGYNSFTGFQPEKKLGVIVLSNSSNKYVDLLGFKLLKLLGGGDPEPFELPKSFKLSADKLEPLVGKYKLNPALVADVTREGDRLFVQLTGQPRIGLYATSDTDFYCRPVDAKFDFEIEDGKAKRMTIHQNGQDIPAARVDSAEKPATEPVDKPADGAEKTPTG
jgi:CubicO group peptidase (beta-lactamase class C family)